MELRVLKYFLTVAQEKTISKAADLLHLSQPTLSKQLKELEIELGVQLFIRGNREITLTEDGYYLVNRGKEIMTLVDNTIINLTKPETISGEISIGGGETEGISFISNYTKDLLEMHPDIKINLYSGNADDVLEKIDRGLIDFGLVVDPVEIQKYEFVKLPYQDQWGLLTLDTNKLSEKTTISPSDLVNEPLFISNQSFVDTQLTRWIGNEITNFKILGTYNLLHNASVLVNDGVGSALCLDGIINTTGTKLKFIPFNPPLTVSVNIIWKKGQVFSKAANVFLKLLSND